MTSRNSNNLLEIKGVTVGAGRLHPTQKPVELLEYLIRTYSNEGETVLYNCMGSGSTGVACIKTNRNFIGIELDKDYFEIAKDRIEKNNIAVKRTHHSFVNGLSTNFSVKVYS